MTPVTITSILFALALLIVVLLYLARPFFMTRRQDAELSRRAQLLAHKEALLYAIRGLDFDHDTGKLPDTEYEQQRAALMSEASETLKALDELPAEPGDSDVYAQIETAVRDLRSRRAKSDRMPVHYCSNCGQGLDSDDKFCAHCGQAVYAVQATT